MVEIRIKVDGEFIERPKKELHLKTNADVAEEALALLSWAVEEKKEDREILSSDKKGKNVKKLYTHNLAQVR